MAKKEWNPEKLLQHLVCSLVGEGVQVKVWTTGVEKRCVVHVCMDLKEINKLAGEGGQVAQAIHTLLNAVGNKHHQSITLKMESLSAQVSSSTKNGKYVRQRRVAASRAARA